MLAAPSRTGQESWVQGFTILAESAWIHAAISLFFLAIAAEAAPSWISTILALFCSALVWRALLHVGAPLGVDIGLAIASGILVTYLVVAFQISDVRWFDAAWPAHTARAAYDSDAQNYFNGALGEVLLALVLWWRGIRLAHRIDPLDSLLATFKVGLVAISLTMVVDVVASANVDAFPMMLLFTASSLTGFWIYFLQPGSRKIRRLRDWAKVIGPVLAAVLAVGVGFGFLINALFPAAKVLLRPLGGVLLFLFDRLLAPIVLPLAYIAGQFWEWAYSIFGTGQTPIAENPQYVEEIREAAEGRSMPPYAEAFLWIAAVAIIGIAFYLIAKAIRRTGHSTRLPAMGEHESVAEDADPLLDMAKLFLGLLPESWLKPKKEPLRLPSDEPGVLEALQIYYGLLRAAEDRGTVRSPSETPTEFQAKLQSLFPADLVFLATEAFVLACYGGRAPSAAELSVLRLQTTPIAGHDRKQSLLSRRQDPGAISSAGPPEQ